MKASYISYFEGYDEKGYLIFSGNGSCTVDYDEAKGIDPGNLLDNHCTHLLGVAQAKNRDVARVCIKNMIRL
ncbi:hypothetical protein ACLEYI_21145 [Enterobacter ludwigii]|jgi:hypothetical protein|uniref:hypothetical protein n=1 Tax=Enterobacter ludwigii TaxID=299767 RepID=UPI00397711B8